MKIFNNINLYVLVATLFFSLLSFEAISAKGFKKNSQKLLIQVDDITGCVSHVELAVSSDDNCAGSNWEKSCGKSVKDCVCMTSKKFITWETSNNSRFQLVFRDDKPFDQQCKLKSGDKKEIKCKIGPDEGEFDYDVIVDTCQSQVYDPRIVVRN